MNQKPQSQEPRARENGASHHAVYRQSARGWEWFLGMFMIDFSLGGLRDEPAIAVTPPWLLGVCCVTPVRIVSWFVEVDRVKVRRASRRIRRVFARDAWYTLGSRARWSVEVIRVAWVRP